MIDYLHCYVNDRSEDWNTCGQAAIATITDYWGRDPFGLSRPELDWSNSRLYWDDGEVIDRIKEGGLGPDVPFGWGTSGGRVAEALRIFGLNASVGFSGFFSFGWDTLWSRLRNYLYWNRPVPVMIDLGAIGGPWWAVHWAIAYKIEGGRVFLGNCPNPNPPIQNFLNAWHCWYLPGGFNHCAVYA